MVELDKYKDNVEMDEVVIFTCYSTLHRCELPDNYQVFLLRRINYPHIRITKRSTITLLRYNKALLCYNLCQSLLVYLFMSVFCLIPDLYDEAYYACISIHYKFIDTLKKYFKIS